MKSQLELELKRELESKLDTNIYNVHIIKTTSKNSSSAPRPTFYTFLPRPARVKHSPSCTGLSQTCALACFCLYVCVCVRVCVCYYVCVSVRVSRFVQQIDFYSPSLYAASNCLSLPLLLLPFLRLRFRRRRCSRRRCVYNQFRSLRGTQLGCCIIRIICCNSSAFVCYLNLELISQICT